MPDSASRPLRESKFMFSKPNAPSKKHVSGYDQPSVRKQKRQSPSRVNDSVASGIATGSRQSRNTPVRLFPVEQVAEKWRPKPATVESYASTSPPDEASHAYRSELGGQYSAGQDSASNSYSSQQSSFNSSRLSKGKKVQFEGPGNSSARNDDVFGHPAEDPWEYPPFPETYVQPYHEEAEDPSPVGSAPEFPGHFGERRDGNPSPDPLPRTSGGAFSTDAGFDPSAWDFSNQWNRPTYGASPPNDSRKSSPSRATGPQGHSSSRASTGHFGGGYQAGGGYQTAGQDSELPRTPRTGFHPFYRGEPSMSRGGAPNQPAADSASPSSSPGSGQDSETARNH